MHRFRGLVFRSRAVTERLTTGLRHPRLLPGEGPGDIIVMKIAIVQIIIVVIIIIITTICYYYYCYHYYYYYYYYHYYYHYHYYGLGRQVKPLLASFEGRLLGLVVEDPGT